MKRIEYIDALRGFTMLLVIFSHVDLFCFGLENSILHTTFCQFRMPLFFFISGFLTYSSGKVLSGRNVLTTLKKKLLIQLVPTIVFGSLFTCIIRHHNVLSFFTDTYFYGYWFTITLFEMFIVYYTLSYVAYKFKLSNYQTDRQTDRINKITIGILFAFTIILVLIPGKVYGDIPLLGNLFRFVQFFVFGNIFARYRYSFEKLLDNGIFTGCIVLLFFIFVSTMIMPLDLFEIMPHKYAIYLFSTHICNYCGLLIVFAFFRKYQFNFTSTTRLGASLQYIGKRTLDIYLLHYFLIPKLPCVGAFLRESPSVILELVCGLTISILIAGVCLLISNTIRISDLLGHYLFGAKIVSEQQKQAS